MGEQAGSAGASAPLKHLLRAIGEDVTSLSFPLEVPGADAATDLRTRLVHQIDFHLLPRLDDEAAPAVVVLGGSTGAGKSTLANSLVGAEVTASGVLRPTTREALVIHHPALKNVPLSPPTASVAAPDIPPGIVLVDAPDLDSLEESNRDEAARLLEAADLWIFVTTAARYGDQVPWENLVRARDRGLQIAVVLNRVPVKARSTVRADLLTRLERVGLGEAPLFILPDLSPHEGLLPAEVVDPVLDWLRAAAGRHQSRAIVNRSNAGAMTAVVEALEELADAADGQDQAAARLQDLTRAAIVAPRDDIATAVSTGSAAVGAPTTRWLTLASTGGVLAPLVAQDRPARVGFRGRARASRDEALGAIAGDAEGAVVTLLADAIQDAAGTLGREWHEAGADDLVNGNAITADKARTLALRTVARWRSEVAGLLDATGFQPTERMRALMSPAGVQSLVVAGAIGVTGAQRAAKELLGENDPTVAATESLAETARTVVEATAQPFMTAGRGIVGRDHAERLRVRASELKGHLRG